MQWRGAAVDFGGFKMETNDGLVVVGVDLGNRDSWSVELINNTEAKRRYGSTHILYEAMRRAGVIKYGTHGAKFYRVVDLERNIATLRSEGWHRGERSKQYQSREGSVPMFSGERKYQKSGKSMTDEEIRNYNRIYPFCRPFLEGLLHSVRNMQQHETHCRGTKA